MAYCIKCGVELGAGEERCPLCHTPVYHPEITVEPEERLYPEYRRPHEEPVSRSGALFLLTALFVLPMVISLLCDVLLNGRLTWFRYVAGSMLLLYVFLVLPLWFQRPNPVVFVSADFAAAALFLLYLERITEGSWFLTFALPLTGGAMVLVVTVVALIKYVRKGYLFIYGGAIIAAGAYTMLLELLLNRTFAVREHLLWSYFPMAACFVLGMALIVIAVSPKLRESLHKKFFL